MRSFKSVLSFAFIAVLMVLASSSSVHARDKMHMKFYGLDQNGDGKITRNEWRSGTDRAFNNQDWNNDGVLSGDEVRPGEHWGGRQDDGRGWDRDHDNRRREWRPSDSFSALDRDNNGTISRNEWNGSNQEFNRLDRGGDQVLTREEFFWDRTHGTPNTPSDSFSALDRDNNGTISRNEWRGSNQEFDRLDRGGDQVLTREEFFWDRQQGTPTDQFRNLDHNGDGYITRDEWHQSSRSFAAFDRNNDGRIDRNELNNREYVRTAVFYELDTNNDSRVSRSEWRGDVAVFSRLDINGDGMLDENEFYSRGQQTTSSNTQQIIEQIFQSVFTKNQ